MTSNLKCPVCSAGFRGEPTCPRCGSSLHQLMRLAARAWSLRKKSRSHLRAGDLARALQFAEKASKIRQSQ